MQNWKPIFTGISSYFRLFLTDTLTPLHLLVSQFCNNCPCLTKFNFFWGDYETGSVRVCVRPGSKSMKNATSLSFLGRFWFCLFYLIGLGVGFKTSAQNFEIHYANLCKFIQNQRKMLLLSVISWPILILFILSDRAWCGLQNFYTEFWNSLIMQIYANLFKINEKCYFVISWPILILFVLSDRAWCGLQNFYTEFWNSLIMQIYSNLFKINEKSYFSVISWPILILFVLSDRAWCGFKINEKCYFSVISWPILILFVLSDRTWCGFQNFYTEFWNSLIMQSYANLFKINEKCYFSVISWPILILFVLSDRAWCGLQNFYTEFWN